MVYFELSCLLFTAAVCFSLLPQPFNPLGMGKDWVGRRWRRRRLRAVAAEQALLGPECPLAVFKPFSFRRPGI